MTLRFFHQQWVLPTIPSIAGIFAAMGVDRDLWFAVPLTLVLTIVFGVVAYLSGKHAGWPTYALLGGIFGWIGSIAALLNLQI